MQTVRSMSGADAASYAFRHLSHNDYWEKNKTVKGLWMGRGAELLGRSGEVALADFENLTRGYHPDTKEYLRPRQNVDRFRERDGEVTKRAAIGLYDCVISAPKAASVMAMQDPRIRQAHIEAANEAILEVESLGESVVRMGGVVDTRRTSNLTIASYVHDSSRSLDPQLHTHFVIFNIQYDAVEGRWKALGATQVYQQHDYITEVYRNRFAQKLAALGYEVKDIQENGKDAGFTIGDIDPKTLEKYSQRSADRDRGIEEFKARNGRLPNKNEIAVIVRETRDRDLQEITTPEVKARQLARLTLEEAQKLDNLYQTALERGSIETRTSARESLNYAKEHTFERLSTARNHELFAEALRHGRGRIDLQELKTELAADVAGGAMIRSRDEVATKATLERERAMVAAIDAGIGKYKSLGRADFVVTQNAREEQRHAVREILASTDFAYNLQGAAGVGKTFALKEIKRGLHENRVSVMCVAPSASAVEVLREDGFKDAETIARLLVDPAMQEELRGRVLIIDEAGMVSSSDMSELVKLAKQKEARIVFSGDTKQVKSVLEGDALRILENESNIRGVSLTQVQRQLDKDYREAMQALRSNPSRAFEMLDAMGAIREADWRLRAEEVSKAYHEESQKLNRFGKESSVLVVAKTHAEISSISHVIRSDLRAAGKLADGEKTSRHSALNWSEAQRRDMRRYEPGQVLLFHKAVKRAAAQHEALEVVSRHKDHVTARRANGELVDVKPGNVRAFGVFEKQEMEIAAGDKLLFQTNWKGKRGEFKATNGERATVAKVEGEKITLTDGREVPAAYRQFAYAYAVTPNYSQGKTCDRVITLDDGMASDKRYVAESRGREGLVIITSDAAALEASMLMSGDRKSASELATQAERGQTWQQIDPETLHAVYEEQRGKVVAVKTQEKEMENYVERDYRGGGDRAERSLSL